MNPQKKLELGIDRALDGVYLAQEALGEMDEKPSGVAMQLDAALRELREALELVPPASRDQVAVPLALPVDREDVQQVFPPDPADEIRRMPDGRRLPLSVPHPFVPPPDQ